jgi:hypothetical protein
MSTPTLPSKAHQDPRISLNKLGEYLQATPTRRKGIVKDQKKPPGAGIVTRYRPVAVALREYFADPDLDFLRRRIAMLRADNSGSDWQKEDRQLSAQALDRLLDMLEQIDLTGVKIIPFPADTQAALFIAGVKVSIRPDFLIVSQADPQVAVGAMKLSHNKQNALQKNSCEYVATLLARFVRETFQDAQIDLKMCLSLATPLKIVASAPKAYKATSEAIDAACEEIAGRWKAA